MSEKKKLVFNADRIFDDLSHPKYLDPSWQPQHGRYYCLHCGSPGETNLGYQNAGQCFDHVVKSHYVDEWEKAEQHVASSDDFLVVREAYWEFTEKSVARFHLLLQSCIGSDDIVFEAGG